MKHIFIINPAAGKYDRTEEYTKKIEAVCRPRGLDYEICRSNAPGDCRRIARAAAAAGEEVRLYACGGDGTLNEVINGAVGFDNAAVTHFPGGSGNDMIKMFSETAPFFDLERLLDCDEAQLDLIRCNETHSANILSMGLDARIGTEMARYKKLPLLSGHGAYLASTLVNLIKGISQHFVITLDDGTRLDDKFTLICACNGRWYGGGFNPVPDAEPDDGLLEVLVVKKVSILTASRVIGKYKAGQYRQFPELISHHRCKSLTIACDKPSVVNVDGEAVFTDVAKITARPRALRFFYPRGLTYRHEN
ncbi:MAG: diacylglycerol/lipid kinase family protein [Oscillospiraceae bacterium]